MQAPVELSVVVSYLIHFGPDFGISMKMQFTVIVKRMNQSNHWLLRIVKQNLLIGFHGDRQNKALVAENLKM